MSNVPTDHRTIEQLLPDFARGVLSEEDAGRVRSHLEECALCREQVSEFDGVFRLAASSRPAGPPEYYFEHLLPRIREQLGRKHAAPAWWHPLIAKALLPGLALGVALLLVIRIPTPTSPNGTDRAELAAALQGLTTEQLLDEAASQGVALAAPVSEDHGSDATLVPDQLVTQQLAAIASQSTTLSSTLLFGDSPNVVLASLSDQEAEQVILRMRERKAP